MAVQAMDEDDVDEGIVSGIDLSEAIFNDGGPGSDSHPSSSETGQDMETAAKERAPDDRNKNGDGGEPD